MGRQARPHDGQGGPRTVAERIRTEFPAGSVGPVEVLASGGGQAAARDVAQRVQALPGVTGVQVTTGNERSTLLSVTCPGEPTSERAQRLVRGVRALPDPDDGRPTHVSAGQTPVDQERRKGLESLPSDP